MIVWHNGQLLSHDEATIAASSAGALLGWGVFTTLGVWNGRAFALAQHLKRLRDNAHTARVETNFSDDEIAVALDKVLRANRIVRGTARITISRRGDGRWNASTGSDLLILARPIADVSTRLRVSLSPHRIEARRPLRGVKTTSFLEYQLAWMGASEAGFDETVLRNSEDFLCEASRANLFWTKDGVLRTPSLDSGCLPGVSREIVLRGARELGTNVEEKLFRPIELQNADEVFLTSSAQGPRAVSELVDESGQRFEYSQDILTSRLTRFWNECVQRESGKS
jgi:branched-chain amino acid aminotransferase